MRKGRLKRFGMYAVIYILITVMATLCTLALDLISPKQKYDTSNAITPSVEETAVEKLLNNVMTLGGANVDLSLDLYEKTETQTARTFSLGGIEGVLPKIKLKFSGSVNIADLQNIALSGTLNAVLPGSQIELYIAYIDNKLYLSNESMDIKIETASFAKIIQILPTLGIDLGGSVDLSGFDPTQILANLQSVEPVEIENGYKLTLNLMENISLDVYTDTEYNLQSVVANKLVFGNMTANLTAGLQKDEQVEITTPKQAEEYVDVTKTLNIMDSVQKIMQDKKMHLNIDAQYLGKTNFGVNGAVDIDYEDSLSLCADLDLNINGKKHNLNFGCVGDDLLFDIDDIKFIADKSDVLATVDWLKNRFGKSSSNTGVLSTIFAMLPMDFAKNLNVDLSNININNLLQFSQGQDNSILLTINGSAIGVDASINVEIQLDDNDQFSSLSIQNLAIADGLLNVRIAYSDEVSFPTVEQEGYLAINDLSSLVPAIYKSLTQILDKKSISVNLCADINSNINSNTNSGDLALGISLDGTATVNFADKNCPKVYASVVANVQNKTFNIKLALISKTLYVSIDNLNFTGSLDNLGELVDSIKATFGAEAGAGVEAVAGAISEAVAGATETATSETATTDLISKLKNLDLATLMTGLIKSIDSDSTKFSMTLSGENLGLGSDITIALQYGVELSKIAVTGLKINNIAANFSAELTDQDYSFSLVDKSFVSLEHSAKLSSAMATTISKVKKNGTATVAFTAPLNIDGTEVLLDGTLAYDNGNIYLNLIASVEGLDLPITAHLISGTTDNSGETGTMIYLNINGLKLALSLNDLTQLFAGLGGVKLDDIALPIDLDSIKSGDFGSLNLDFIKGISISESETVVTLAKALLNTTSDLVLTLKYNNSALTGIVVSGLEFSTKTANKTNTFSASLSSTLFATADIPAIDYNEFLAVENLPELVPAVIDTFKKILNNGQISLSFSTAVSVGTSDGISAGEATETDNSNTNSGDLALGISLDGTATVNFADKNCPKVYASVVANVQNKTFNIKLALISKTLYVSIDNLNFTGSLDNLGELVDSIKATFGAEAGAGVEAVAGAISEAVAGATETATSETATTDLISKLKNLDLATLMTGLIKSIDSDSTKFSMTLSGENLGLGSDITIALQYGVELSKIAVTGLKINNIAANFSAELTDQDYSFSLVDKSFVSLEHSAKLSSAMATTISKVKKNGTATVAFTAPLNIDGTEVLLDGTLAYDNGNIYLNLIASVEGLDLPITAHLISGTTDNSGETGTMIYLNINGLKLALSLNDLTQLFAGLGGVKLDDIALPIDLDSIKSGDFGSLNLDFIKGISISESETVVTLAKALLNTTSDLVLTLKYNNSALTGIVVSGLEFSTKTANKTNTFSASLSSTLSTTADIPAIDYNEFSEIGDIKTVIPTMLDSIKTIVADKRIALNIGVDLQKSDTNYGISGLFYADWSKLGAKFDILDMDIYADISVNIAGNSYSVETRLLYGTAYITFENLKITTTISSLSDLVDSIKELLPNSTEFDTKWLDEILAGSRIAKILDGDYSVINGEAILGLVMTESSSEFNFASDVINTEKSWSVSLGYSETLDSIEIADFSINGINTGALIKINREFEPAMIVASDYSDIDGLNSTLHAVLDTIDNISTNKTVALKIGNMELSINNEIIKVSGEAYLDFGSALIEKDSSLIFDYKKLKGYAGLNIFIEGGDEHNIIIFMDGERIYLSYNNLNLSVSLDKIDSLIDIIGQLKFITESLQTADLDNVTVQQLIDDAKEKSEGQPIVKLGSVDVNSLVASLLPKLDLNAIKNGDYSSIDPKILLGLEATNSLASVVIDRDFFGTNGDLNIQVYYDKILQNIIASNISVSSVTINKMNITLKDKIDIAELDESKYSSLDSIDTFMNSLLKTAVEVVDNQHISFGLNTALVHENIQTDSNNTPIKATLTNVTVKDSSCAKFDWAGAYEKVDSMNKFNIKKMRAYVNFDVVTVTHTYYYTNGVRNGSPAKSVTRNHAIVITYIDNMIYIKYNNMYAKISGESIRQIVISACQILGIENVDDDLFDSILSIASNAKSEMQGGIFDKITADIIKSFTLSDSTLNGVFNLSSFGLGIDALNNLNLNVLYNADGLKNLVLRNLKVGNNSVDSVNIGLKNFVAISSAPQGSYIDLSNIGSMLTAVQNSLEYDGFEFSGNVKLKINVIGIKLDWTVPLNAKIKLVNGGFEANVKLGEIPVITGVNNDARYEVGNTITAKELSPGKDRILNIYIKDNWVYIHRTEQVPYYLSWKYRTYEKKLKIHLDTLISNPLEYLLKYGLGMSNEIMNAIYESVNKERQNPLDYSNLLKGFSSSNNVNTMTLNLKELAENDKLDTMTLGIRNTTHNGKSVVGGIIFDMQMPVADNVNISMNANELQHINIGQNLNMSTVDNYAKSYGYIEGAKWDSYNGDWQQISQEEYSLTFVTGSSESFPTVSGVSGQAYTLPTPKSFETDDGIYHRTYTFAGWYASKDYDEATIYQGNVYPRKNTTLYAKWDIDAVPYYQIMFETNCTQNASTQSILSGNICELPTLLDYIVDDSMTSKNEYKFAGWYTTPNFATNTKIDSQFVVDKSLYLYANWLVTTTPYYAINFVYNDSSSLANVYILEGDTLELPVYTERKEVKTDDQITTYTFIGWYTSPDFATDSEVSGEIKITKGMVLYEKWYEEIRCRVMVDFVTNNPDIFEPSISDLEGAVFTLPNYTDIMIVDSTLDDATIEYEFDGWYRNETLADEYKFERNNIPVGGVTLYAKWTEIRRTHYARVYDGSELLWTSARLYEGETISVELGTKAKLNSRTMFYDDINFATQLSDWAMTNCDRVIYARNEYTVTIKSNIATRYQNESFTLYQSSKVTSVTNRVDYNVDTTDKTYLYEYKFLGYFVGDQQIDFNNYLTANSDVEITAKWSKNDRKYYTVTFSSDWMRAGWWWSNGSKVSMSLPNGGSARILAGDYLVASDYVAKAVYSYGGPKYSFESCCWNTSGARNVYDGSCGNGHKLQINGNITVYAVWKHV